MNESRRGFLKTIGAVLALGVPAAALLDGCASAGLPVYRYDNSGGRIDLYLRWYPELLTTGGVIELLVGGETASIYVARVSFSRFAAFSPECTSDGCKVKPGKNSFKCPCDGSTYYIDGSMTSGPATEPLRSFRTQFLDTSVRIFLS